MGYQQDVSRPCLALWFPDDGSVVLGADIVDQPVEALGDLLRAPT